MSPPPLKATPKKETTAKRAPVRQRNARQNSNIKSRAIVSTDSSSSEDDTATKKKTNKNTLLVKEIPSRQKTAVKTSSPAVNDRSTLLSPRQLRTSISPRGASSVQSKRTTASSSDDDDEDDENSNSVAGKRKASFRGSFGSSLSESDESVKENHKVDKVKSDKNKNVTLRKLFSWGTKGDGGAKGKGQVVIVDHSEDAQKSAVTNITRDFNQASNSNNKVSSQPTVAQIPPPTSLICKIDLSRLNRIPAERIGRLSANNHNNNNNSKSPFNIDSGRRSTLKFRQREDDRNTPNDLGQNGSRNNDRGNHTSSSESISSDSSTDSENNENVQQNGGVCYENDNHPTTVNKLNNGNSNTGSQINTRLSDSRLPPIDKQIMRNHTRVPKLDAKPMNKIKRESHESDTNNSLYNHTYDPIKSPKSFVDDKIFSKLGYTNVNCLSEDPKNSNSSIKRERNSISLYPILLTQ